MGSTQLYSITLNPLQTNCYLLVKENHCIIFDPSVDKVGDLGRLADKIKQDWIIDAIVLTHGHYDHISAIDLLYDKYHCPIYIHHLDEEYLHDSSLNASRFMNIDYETTSPYETINQGELAIGEFKFEVVLTPGHTPGSITLFYEDYAFVGDCLFKGSIGRTDLKGGSNKAMKQSLDYFKKLEKDYQILPGHGDRTTLSKEKIMNPFLNGEY